MTERSPVSATPVALDGFAICNSRGRRVSLLNEDDQNFVPPPYPPPSSVRHYSSSPTHTTDSENTDLAYGSFHFSNTSPASTSPSIPSISPHLPPVTDLISFTIPKYDLADSRSRNSSISSNSNYSSRGSIVSVSSRRRSGQLSRSGKRRYECVTCGKTFTTSGHVARHNRIHTGEKNFQCPEPGCSQRFSRQDNCMQHYRTHKSHSQTAHDLQPSSEWIDSSSPHKRRRAGKNERDTSVDPNDRLNALATYISVYA